MRFIERLFNFNIYMMAAALISLSAHAQVESLENSDSANDSIGTEYFTIDEKTTVNDVSIQSDESFMPLTVVDQLSGLVEKARAVQKIDLLKWVKHDATQPEIPEKYKRLNHFGTWIKDPTRTTCFNTRMQVLVRDSAGQITTKEHNRCAIAAGTWEDPYTNTTFHNAAEIQIDHLVPLKHAYLAGAWKWNYGRRCHYGNYMGNNFHLLAVAGRENMRKGDRSPDSYMPPNEQYSCQYLEIWLKTKAIWRLKLAKEEAIAIQDAVKDYNCDPELFKMTKYALKKQRSTADDIPMSCQKN